jgi:hypothetical protein
MGLLKRAVTGFAVFVALLCGAFGVQAAHA